MRKLTSFSTKLNPMRDSVHAKNQLSEFGHRGEKVGINVYLRRFDQSQGTG